MSQAQVRYFSSSAAHESFLEVERQARLNRHAREAIARIARRAERYRTRGIRAAARCDVYSRPLIAFPLTEAELAGKPARVPGRAPKLVIFQGGSPGLGRRC